jgi:hypothetical protein
MAFAKLRSTPFRRFPAAAICGAALLAGATLASADWLVTTDGGLIETRGPWRIEGSRVIFASANGTLTAVRASSIDFQATEDYAAELAAPAPAAPPVPAEPVLVLTDRDVPRVRAAEPAVEPAAAEGEAASGDPAAGAAPSAEVSAASETAAVASPSVTPAGPAAEQAGPAGEPTDAESDEDEAAPPPAARPTRAGRGRPPVGAFTSGLVL